MLCSCVDWPFQRRIRRSPKPVTVCLAQWCVCWLIVKLNFTLASQPHTRETKVKTERLAPKMETSCEVTHQTLCRLCNTASSFRSAGLRTRKWVRKQDRRCKCNLVGGCDLDVNVEGQTGRASGSWRPTSSAICPAAVVEESRGTTSASKLLRSSVELLCRRKCRWLRLVRRKERNGRRKSFLNNVSLPRSVRDCRTRVHRPLLDFSLDTPKQHCTARRRMLWSRC